MTDIILVPIETPVSSSSVAGRSSGYNLWTWRDYVMYLLESRMNSAASADLTESVLLRVLNDAHLEACRLAQFRRSTEFSIDAVSGTRAYSLPATTMQDKVVQVRFGDGSTFSPLSMLPVDRFLEMYQDGAETGTPRYYTIVPGVRQFWVGPTPDASVTGGLRLIAQTVPDPLSRLCQSYSHSVTASVTTGSATVTLSGTLAADVQMGDEFGIVPTLQSDASEMVEASPQEWRVISAVSSPITSLTLAEVYTGPTLTAAAFVTAQVPSLESAYPGQYGMMIPQLAAARLLSTRDPNLSDRLRGEALQAFNLQMDTSFRAVVPKTAIGRTSLVRPY